MGRPEECDVNWLKDENMLPKVVPNAQIIRYGYESQWFGEEAISQKVPTVAQRLLLSLKRNREVGRSYSAISHSCCANGYIGMSAPPSEDSLYIHM